MDRHHDVNNGTFVGRTRKYHGCENVVSPDNLAALRFNSLTASNQTNLAEIVIKHELAHCVGLDHVPGTNTDLMNPISTPSTPFALSNVDRILLETYFP